MKLGTVPVLDLFNRALEGEYYHTIEKSRFVNSVDKEVAGSTVRCKA